MEFVWHIKGRKLVHIEATLSLSEKHFVVQATLLDFVVLILFKPFDSLSLLPQATLSRLPWHFIGSQAVLLATAPMTRVGASIRPGVDAEAMFLIIFVFTAVLPSVLPSVDANAIHVIIDPLPFKLATVKPGVCA